MRARYRFTLSLRSLLILLASIGLLPLALFGIWSVHHASEQQRRDEARYMLDLARALSSAVDAELDNAVATLNGMANSPALAAGDIRSFYEVAKEQAQSQPEWLAVLLTDAKGNVLFRTSAPFGDFGGPIADPESLKKALSLNKPIVGRTVRGPNGRVAFPVRVPVQDDKGRIYVLTAAIQPDRILRVIQRQDVPSSSVISIIDSSGVLAARSRNHRQTVGGPPSETLRRLMRSNPVENVGKTLTLEGEPITSAYTKVSRYGWTVAVGVPAGALSPILLSGFTAYGLGIVISLAACIGLASVLANCIVYAFNSLQAGTAALGAGEPVVVMPSGVKEIDLIGQALAVAAKQRTAHEEERTRLLASLEAALKQQEQALVEARKASRVKDEFLAVLGHELRNPLSPIVASLDLMDMRHDAANGRERTIMRRQVSHLKRLVDDLLDVSRITSGKLQIDRQIVNLADIARDTTAALPAEKVELSAPAELWVKGDESRLAQVFNNLLSNAARFSNDTVRIALTAQGSYAKLVVSDSGIGMKPEMLAQIFEPFFQAPQQLARATGGLGLGLAIVRKIVELHDGRVSAHSAGPGKGSSFEVELPLAHAAASPCKAADALEVADQRILLVDDNEDAAFATAVLLEHVGANVRVAHTAAEALALFEQHQPTIAILDIGLPDMDGYDLASRLRQASQGLQLRLIALTGYAQANDVRRALEAGFDHHLTKPATVDDLRRALS